MSENNTNEDNEDNEDNDRNLLKIVKTYANKEMAKDFVKLSHWFMTHNCSSYMNADKATQDHVDILCIEYNRQLDLIKKRYDIS